MDQRVHSVTFGDGTIFPHGTHEKKGFARGANTWDDWNLIPAHRPEIVPPEVYTNYVDLPAVHGKLDLSEYLTGGPVYKNRSGSLEFIVPNGYGFWAERYNQICNFLHGKKLKMILWDEPEYFYTGRFAVEGYKSDGNNGFSSVTIKYELEPFKFLLPRQTIDEYWDRFLFEDIHPYQFLHHIHANQNQTFTVPGYTNGFMMDGFIDDSSDFPATATVTLNDGILTLSRSSREAHTVRSGSLNPVVNTTNVISVTGTGKVNLVCWGGSL